MNEKILATSRVLFKSKVQQSERLVLLTLAVLSDKDGISSLTLKLISSLTLISKRQVIRIIKKLEKLDELYVLRNQGGGRGRKNTYIILSNLNNEEISNILTNCLNFKPEAALRISEKIIKGKI